MKHLITSGCSFTETWLENPVNGQTWADYLAPMAKMQLHNVAMSGAGNHIISTYLINKTEELLSLGIPSSDICVVVQWSGIFRFDRVLEKQITKQWHATCDQRPVWIKARATGEKRFEPPEETDNNWVMCAGARQEGIWPALYSMTSKEQAFFSPGSINLLIDSLLPAIIHV